MPVLAWILIAVAIVALVAGAIWAVMRQRRSRTLQERFGPEYQRALTERGGRRKGESELAARQRRRDQLDIRPLAPEARQRHSNSWRDTQTRFVDDPSGAVRDADRLVILVMQESGYPMDDFEQRSSDISVDHPQVVNDYRAAHAISMANDHDQASTEDLRQAMVHYRTLFEQLLRAGQDERTTQAG